MTEVPRFGLPFRFGKAPGQTVPSLQVVEQDTIEDIANCVEIVLRYPRGFRSDVPEFGINDLALRQQPVPMDDLVSSVARWEPRARTDFEQAMDRFDVLIARIVASVSERTP